MNRHLIEVVGLTKKYGDGDEAVVYALNELNTSVDYGEFVAIMGPSGSGKSTLMNILGCLDKPTSGKYWLDGKEVSGLSRDELADVRNQKIGFVFQSFNLLPRLSALDNVMMPMIYDTQSTRSTVQLRQRAAEALEAVGLANRLHHHPNQLSGGQQQRVAIARALINQPPLILADEPTGNLDTKASIDIMALLHRLHESGTTIVMVTHEADIAQHAQRIVCVRDGVSISDGREGNSPCLEKNSASGER